MEAQTKQDVEAIYAVLKNTSVWRPAGYGKIAERLKFPTFYLTETTIATTARNIFIKGKFRLYYTLEVRTIEVEEEHRNEGYASRFFNALEYIARESCRILYVEVVLSDYLKKLLLKRGYESLRFDEDSYMKYSHLASLEDAVYDKKAHWPTDK